MKFIVCVFWKKLNLLPRYDLDLDLDRERDLSPDLDLRPRSLSSAPSPDLMIMRMRIVIMMIIMTTCFDSDCGSCPSPGCDRPGGRGSCSAPPAAESRSEMPASPALTGTEICFSWTPGHRRRRRTRHPPGHGHMTSPPGCISDFRNLQYSTHKTSKL